jgi:hypothetical protein
MKKVLLAGLLGGFVMLAWLIVVDAMLGFRRSIDMKALPDERSVYSFLVEQVPEPGIYVVNPEVSPDRAFPGHDPIFGVHYTGLGHDDAGKEVLVGLLIMLLAPMAGAWLLTRSSPRVLSRYRSRVGFLAMVGAVMALMVLGARFGLASFSFGAALALALHDLAAWTLAGCVVAWRIRDA